MRTLQLTEAESCRLWDLAGMVRDPVKGSIHPADLPVRLSEHVTGLIADRDGVSLVSGLPVIDDDLGPTPEHWNQVKEHDQLDAVAALVSSMLGLPFGWPGEQEGRLVQNIMPIRTHERDQINSGSAEVIWWHTEDAYQPTPPAFLTLLCLRNDERAETTFSTIAALQLASEDIAALREPCFEFSPDHSNVGPEQSPRRYPVLTGPDEDIRLRVDPYFMSSPPSLRHASALERLSAQLEAGLDAVALAPGDLLVVDNFRAVHGRRPFRAAYGPRGRWVKRVHVGEPVNLMATSTPASQNPLDDESRSTWEEIRPSHRR